MFKPTQIIIIMILLIVITIMMMMMMMMMTMMMIIIIIIKLSYLNTKDFYALLYDPFVCKNDF